MRGTSRAMNQPVLLLGIIPVMRGTSGVLTTEQMSKEDHPRHAGNIESSSGWTTASKDHPRHAGNMQTNLSRNRIKRDHPRHAGNIGGGFSTAQEIEDHPRHAGNIQQLEESAPVE